MLINSHYGSGLETSARCRRLLVLLVAAAGAAGGGTASHSARKSTNEQNRSFCAAVFSPVFTAWCKKKKTAQFQHLNYKLMICCAVVL